MTYRVCTLAASLMFCATAALAQAPAQQVVEPKGEYAQIETRHTRSMIGLLTQGSADDQALALETFMLRPGMFQPPVLFAISQHFLQAGKKYDAAFLFYAAQLRARMDANLSTDRSAGQAVGALSMRYGGPLINQYMLQDLAQAERLMAQVQEWDAKTPYEYDRRWISLHGMGAFTASADQSAKPLTVAKDQWPAIIEKTRKDYFAGFQETLAELRARPAK